MVSERILVTAALPYANGPLHIGHAIGCYVPADVYTRFKRLSGADVLYVCGTDEHGTPITVTAENEGVGPQEVVDKYHKMHVDAFKNLGVEFDNFSGTARSVHHKISQGFFLKALKNGFVEKKTVERPYCPSCARFLPDRYVKGTCPHCSSQDQRGDQCEACGKQLEPHELKDAYCTICHGTPELRETTHWFFKLSKSSRKLEEWITNDCKHWPANARNFALGWIREGLQDRAITRDLSWGIPVPDTDLDGNPIEGTKGKVLYVWFDAPIGYISSTKEWAETRAEKGEGKPDDWKKYWTGDTKIVHFIGKDNIPFHTIIWPATLLAEGSFALPWQVASNEFLNLEGRKVSTSRGWVIWLHDILNEFEADALRYYLLSIAPETSDSDFSLNEFKERVNNELIATLGNFINRTLSFLQNKKESIVPEPLGQDNDDNNILDDIKALPADVGGEIEKFRLKHALDTLMHYAAKGNKYFQKKEPWKHESSTTLYNCVNLVASLAIAMYPFLPESAEKIWRTLRLPGKVSEQKWEDAGRLLVEPGHRIGEVKPLYKKIEDAQIEEFKKKYLPTGENKKEEKEDRMPEISYTDFEKMDLRVGEILSAEAHPSADKLYVLKVDLGGLGERQLVAGVRESYSIEELLGMKIIVIANLAPAKIRGIKSDGMLLAAVDENKKPTLVTADAGTPNGSKIM